MKGGGGGMKGDFFNIFSKMWIFDRLKLDYKKIEGTILRF